MQLFITLLVMTCLLLTTNTISAANNTQPPVAWSKNTIKIDYFNHNIAAPDLPVPPSPLFWKNHFVIDSSEHIFYERLLYHTRQHFALYGGADIGMLHYKKEDSTVVAAFLGIHLYAFRRPGFSPYLNYSIAAPAWLGKNPFGDAHFSNRFVFQDVIGLGINFEPKLPLQLGFDIIHYSNGDIFPKNSGIQIPFAFSAGYTF